MYSKLYYFKSMKPDCDEAKLIHGEGVEESL